MWCFVEAFDCIAMKFYMAISYIWKLFYTLDQEKISSCILFPCNDRDHAFSYAPQKKYWNKYQGCRDGSVVTNMAAFPEDPSSNSCTHMTTNNRL